MKFRLAFWMVPLFLFLSAVTAFGSTIDVYPTNTPTDIQNVQAAIASAQPGDTILLHAGTFDWSGNGAALAPFAVPFGLPVTKSDVTIEGETDANGSPLTTISGPLDSTGYPLGFPSGANIAFVDGPGATGVTIQNLVFQNFENAIVLLQDTPSLGYFSYYYQQGADFSAGASDWTIQSCRFLNVRAGIIGSGANNGVTIQNNYVQALIKNGSSIDDSGVVLVNSGGIFLFSLNPQEAPADVVVQGNTVVGSGPDFETLDLDGGTTLAVADAGIGVQGAANLLVQDNNVQNFTWGMSVAAEGKVTIFQNTVASTQMGLRVLDATFIAGGDGEPSGVTTNALIKGNKLTGNVLLPTPPSIGSESAPLVHCGCGILTNADSNRYVGNNLNNNAVAGIELFGDGSGAADLTATGNFILGNPGLVAGSSYVLANNSISGSSTSVVTVGQAISQTAKQGSVPVF